MNQRLLIIVGGVVMIAVIGTVLVVSSKPTTKTPTSAETVKILQGEAAAGVSEQQQASIMAAQYPIINQLPVVTDTYKIGSGLSVAHKGNPSYFAIYISADTAGGKSSALQWMTSNGYNPKDYEIIYQGYNQ